MADAKGGSPGFHELHPALWKHSRLGKHFVGDAKRALKAEPANRVR
jgi:hypothetical protein